jgi:Solitary outer membrane autotransporter beta-barrel domain
MNISAMTVPNRIPRPEPRWWALLPGLALAPIFANSQPVLTPDAIDEFQHVIGSRIEAVTILGGDNGAAGGFYTFRGGNKADLNISKLGGGGIVAAPAPLGVDNLEWAPVLNGNIGSASTENDFPGGYLQGNHSLNHLLAAELGAGARFYFTEHLSLTPTISGIYGHVKNEFTAENAVGDLVKASGGGTYVDWTVKTWSAVPALDLDYEFNWGRTSIEVESCYTYFHTESFSSTSPVVNVAGDSMTWQNKLDLDVPLGWSLFGRELHTGGYFARTELSGGAVEGLNENHIYTANGRLVLDVLGRIWKVRWIGIGASYFWGEHFDGWSAGLDMRFQF